MLLIGQTLEGYCGGYFGRDSYDDKRIEAVGIDWVIARSDNGKIHFACGDDIHSTLSEYVLEQNENTTSRNIKVLVVSTEEDSGIDQSSTVEEILEYNRTRIYDSIGQVFQDLNDEEITDRFWFFLVDMDTMTHLNEH